MISFVYVMLPLDKYCLYTQDMNRNVKYKSFCIKIQCFDSIQSSLIFFFIYFMLLPFYIFSLKLRGKMIMNEIIVRPVVLASAERLCHSRSRLSYRCNSLNFDTTNSGQKSI